MSWQTKDPKVINRRLRAEIDRLARAHHCTVVASKMHDPIEKNIENCPLPSCQRALAIANGDDPEWPGLYGAWEEVKRTVGDLLDNRGDGARASAVHAAMADMQKSMSGLESTDEPGE